ncbi:MAG TPA: hypothetical protein VN864_01920 [Thermoplasmata archaeon]|nr:hypothetical protein [Thermoplasmata archaeon]
MTAVLIVGLLVGLALGGAFSGGSNAAGPPAPVGPSYLYLTVTTSAHTAYDTYYPANVSVPHGEPVVVTITSYDNGVNPVPSPYGNVIGTDGDVANYTLAPNQSTETAGVLPSSVISHTFSVTLPGMAGEMLLGEGRPMINVPVPISPDGILPATVSFTVIFSAPGEYAWRCLAPCDPYSMSTPGFMSGSIVVT